MLNVNIISDFLGLRNVIVTGFSEKNNFINVYLANNKSNLVCPCCGNTTSRAHDYRLQTVKHCYFRNKQIGLSLKSIGIFVFIVVKD